MSNFTFNHISIWLLIFGILGCQQPTETVLISLLSATEQPDVVIAQPVYLTDKLDQEWFLVSFDDQGSKKKVIANTQTTIQFSTERLLIETFPDDFGHGSLLISGSAGCNRYFAGYQLKNRYDLTIERIVATEMACPDPVGIMQQEDTYLQLLSRAKAYYIRDGRLTLYNEDKVAILIFQQKENEE